MELFTQLFGDLLAFVYHCFDRIVIYGYLSGLSRPEQGVMMLEDRGILPLPEGQLDYGSMWTSWRNVPSLRRTQPAAAGA
jgi:hypothetical protein